MKELRWVVQNNLGNSREIPALLQACDDLGIEAYPVQPIPFSDEIPDVPTDKLAIFYGSARFVATAHRAGRWTPCAFWDDEVFSVSSWGKAYGSRTLNHDGAIRTLGDLRLDPPCEDDEVVFLRPDRDVKEFAGQLMSGKELRDWIEGIAKLDGEGTVTLETKVLVARPKTLHHEWRLFIVGGRVCTGSHYRRYGQLDVNPDVPEAVIQFAEEATRMWAPDEIFVMDIGECQGELKIIEINGFNSTGFYAADIPKIVDQVSSHLLGG